MFPHLWAIKPDEMQCTVSAPARYSALFTFPIAIISSILAALQTYYWWKSLIDDCGRFNPVSGLNNGINIVKIKTIELRHKSVLYAPGNFDLFPPSNLFYFQPETTCGVGGFMVGCRGGVRLGEGGLVSVQFRPVSLIQSRLPVTSSRGVLPSPTKDA